MSLIYKCRIIRHNENERQIVTIESKSGVTNAELKAMQKKDGWIVETIKIDTEEFIYNSFKNKGYEVSDIYIPTVKNQYKEIDNYAADVDILGHVFLGYTTKEVRRKLSKIKDYFE